ncbi:Hsp70 family protein [Clostridium baratii]|uniref:Hsp70 family protein n=1 Tax=Clostridium baratii TaxID=1561 RepID=UPI0030CAC3BD
MKYFGIDFGNGNCSISSIDENGENLEILKSELEEDKIKSKIAFKDLNTVIVGKEDLDEEDLDNIELIKSKFGIEKFVEIKGQKRSVQYCGAILMKYLIKNVAKKDSLERAVITIPAIYGQRDRRIVYDSALQASIGNVELIEEPSAAAMYYLYEQSKDNFYMNIGEKDILIFDFGTGTLDMSLINITYSEQGIKTSVKATEGERNLGGYLIDVTLAEYILETYIEEFDIEELEEYKEYVTNHITKYTSNQYNYLNFLDKEKKKYIEEIIIYAEDIKKRLSDNEKVTVKLNNYEEIDITREDFENYVLDKYITKKINDLINRFNLINKSKIGEIVMVGGSSQIPYIKELLQKKFKNKNIITNSNYINAVSLGAAITSALNSGASIEPFGKNNCKGIIPNNIYLNFNGEDNLIFKKGTSYPYSKIEKVKIPYSLCSNIKVLVKENDEILDKINFYHPCFYTGDIINVYCDIDEKGLISFKAEHKESKEFIALEIESINRLTCKQIEGGRKNIKEVLKFI